MRVYKIPNDSRPSPDFARLGTVVARPRRSLEEGIKRAIDLGGSLALALVALPVFVGVAMAVVVTMGRPVLFAQQRAGRDGRPFVIYKFRTMRPADPDQPDVPSAQRLTSAGRLLRKLSLDELPQLFNVMKGEMSLVGPRPLLLDYLPIYNDDQRRRHQTKPGITGLAQVSGRSGLSWTDRLALDVQYVDERCLRLDIKIIFRTAVAVLHTKNTSPSDRPIAERFNGIN